MKKVKAKADWENDKLTITYNEITHEIPITCTQQMDPNKFVALDHWGEELELEEDDDNGETMRFNNARIEKNEFIIGDRAYSQSFMEYCKIKEQKENTETSPGKCYCGKLTFCTECDIIKGDWNIYNALEESEIQKQSTIYLEKDKEVPIGKITLTQQKKMQKLLTNNKDLFARNLKELGQTNEGEHAIITEDVYPIKKNAYRTSPKENEFI
jgi:hypothetical protein